MSRHPGAVHHTREGKVYCAAVLDTYSRRIVGWSMDLRGGAGAEAGTIIHSDHGVQFASWAFTKRAKDSSLVPSIGSIGDCYDNSMIESFWSHMQVELLDRQRWTTRLELANAMFDYIEIWHDRQRRHSSLGMLTPVQFELQEPTTVAEESSRTTP